MDDNNIFEIVESFYDDFDNITIDVLQLTYSNGMKESRTCWTDERIKPVHYLITRSGEVLRSEWGTTQTNKWLNAYKELWAIRYKEKIIKDNIIVKTDLGCWW